MKQTLKRTAIIFLMFAMTLSLTGCGEIRKAETTVNNMFAAFKALDFEEAQKYVNVEELNLTESDSDMTTSNEQFLKAMFDKLKYNIVSSEKIDKNTVHVTTNITAMDMEPVMDDFFKEAINYSFTSALNETQPTEEEITQKMEELLVASVTKPDLDTMTTKVEIKVIKEDGTWKVVSDDTFANALLGGMLDIGKELENAMSNLE